MSSAPSARSEARKLRALLVLPDLPLLEGGAPGRYFVALLRGLRENGVEVRAIAARRSFTPPGRVPEDLPVEIVDFEQPSRWRSRLKHIRRPMGELAGGRFGSRVEAASREVDIVHVETTGASWVDRGVRAPRAFHFHYLAGLDRPYGSPWTKQFWHVAHETVAERAMMRDHRYVIASSPDVASGLREHAPNATITLSPLCLEPEHYRVAAVGLHARAGLIGTAGWPATATAVDRLVHRIWPIVRREVRNAEVVIAGRGSRRLVPSSPPGVDVLGEVSDATAFFESLGMLLYPVERGSGMKVKVLEALAMGVPVVTTPAGAVGIAPNAGVVVAEDDQAIARATVSLLEDGAERVERGAAGRRTFDTHYTPKIATRSLVELYTAMASAQ